MTDSCAQSYTPLERKFSSLMPISRGEERCTPNHFWGAGVRSCYVIHYILSGRGVFYCGTQKYGLQKGQFFVVFPGTIVKYQADGEDPWHYIWVNFDGEEAKEVLIRAGLSIHRPVGDIGDWDPSSLVRKMPEERSSDLRENLRFTAQLYELMSLLLEDCTVTEKSENEYLSDAVQYIRSHYCDDITVEQTAAHVNISRKYLFSLFKKGMGIAPQEYILQVRMQHACELLQDNSLSVGRVACSVGYRDPLLFSRMFRKKLGISPSEYRKNCRNTSN